MQKEIIGLSKKELSAALALMGEKPFRTKQIWQWLYVQGVTSFAEMTNLSKELREKLSAAFIISRPKIITEQISADKTHKWLLEFADGQRVETVFIPEDEHGAVCVSTQVGCAVGCKFCHTGSQKITRNLTAGEIISQFMLVKDVYGEWPSSSQENRLVSNIVVMGMGEPLHNVDNVITALNIATDQDGLAVSKRRITLSTSGIVPNIPRIAQETGVKLAISLHAPTHEERAELMPAERGMSIQEVVDLLKNYDFSHQRRLSFEYIVFGGKNDSMRHAQQIVKLLSGLDCRVNLIRFHQIPDVPLKGASEQTMENLRDYLTSHGVFTTIRASRGQDIYAACGLLSTAKKNENLNNN